MALERDEYGYPRKVGEVAIEEVDERVGWAVFTGRDGDSINWHAFFRRKEDAEHYVSSNEDSDSDHHVFDPCIVPAAVIGGRIVAANHYDDELGAGVILRLANVVGDEAETFREDAGRRTSTASPEGNAK